MKSRSHLALLLLAVGTPAMTAQENDTPRREQNHAILTRIENAGPKENLSVLQSGLDSLDYRLADPDGYASMVTMAFNTLYEKGTADVDRARHIHQKYLLSALEHPDRLSTVMELELVLRLRPNVSSGDSPNKDEVRAKLKLLFHAWRRMEHDAVPGYNFDPASFPSESVMPPGGGYPGMDPALISDSKLREKYLAAIEENRIKAVAHNLQIYLRKNKERFIGHVERSLVFALNANAIDESEALSELSLVKNDGDRERVLSKLRSRSK